MKKTRFSLAAVLALGLIAAGCGGGSDSSTSSSSGDTLTKEEFVSQANAICTTAQADFKQVQEDITKKVQADPSQIQASLQEALTKITPILRDTVNKIGALNPPEDLQSKLDDFVTKVNDAADQIEADPAKFAQDATNGDNPFANLTEDASALGLQNCGPGASGG
jgi:ABC-type glycerol-3-phosphate transport system substrate-binding protein